MLENRMILDEYERKTFVENDEEDIFALINEECEEFDNWEENHNE